MIWPAALSSFLGATSGAGLATWATLRGQRQDARGEWRLRLDRAIDLVTAATEEQRLIGEELLTDLIESDLGSEEDRDLARRIAHVRLGRPFGQAPIGVDPTRQVGDNEGEATRGRRS